MDPGAHKCRATAGGHKLSYSLTILLCFESQCFRCSMLSFVVLYGLCGTIPLSENFVWKFTGMLFDYDSTKSDVY